MIKQIITSIIRSLSSLFCKRNIFPLLCFILMFSFVIYPIATNAATLESGVDIKNPPIEVNPGGKVLKWGANALFGLVAGTVAELLYGILTILAWFLSIIGAIVNWLIAPVPIVTSAVVQIGWSITLGFANMFFILIFWVLRLIIFS